MNTQDKMKKEIEKEDEIPKGFERLIKGEKLGHLPKRTIAFTGDKITFSKDLCEFLFKYYGVNVYINKIKKIILFVPSNNTLTACKISRPYNNKAHPNSSLHIFSKMFRRNNIKVGAYPVRYNLGKIEFRYKEVLGNDERN